MLRQGCGKVLRIQSIRRRSHENALILFSGRKLPVPCRKSALIRCAGLMTGNRSDVEAGSLHGYPAKRAFATTAPLNSLRKRHCS